MISPSWCAFSDGIRTSKATEASWTRSSTSPLFLAETFDKLGVPYLVGGSLASSLHGLPRATQDVGLVAALAPEHVARLVAALRESFYLDEAAIRTAVRERTSFNVIHLGTLFKADIFVAKDDPVGRAEFERRQH